ncbi:hypothetical protein DW690_04710 [Dorea longicatena]|nr:hypothetical protein DW690_04710 [Dorea longicatena]
MVPYVITSAFFTPIIITCTRRNWYFFFLTIGTLRNLNLKPRRGRHIIDQNTTASCRGAKFTTEGLYLNKKSITLMVCIEKEREEEILEYIRQSCTERVEEKLVSEFNGQMFVDVVKGVKIGGATVFTADVDKIMKF